MCGRYHSPVLFRDTEVKKYHRRELPSYSSLLYHSQNFRSFIQKVAQIYISFPIAIFSPPLYNGKNA